MEVNREVTDRRETEAAIVRQLADQLIRLYIEWVDLARDDRSTTKSVLIARAKFVGACEGAVPFLAATARTFDLRPISVELDLVHAYDDINRRAGSLPTKDVSNRGDWVKMFREELERSWSK